MLHHLARYGLHNEAWVVIDEVPVDASLRRLASQQRPHLAEG